MRQLHCVPTTYVTQNKENYLEMYTCQVSCPLISPLSNCQSILNTCGSTANCLYLYDSYISKLELMDYLIAKLVVAWL